MFNNYSFNCRTNQHGANSLHINSIPVHKKSNKILLYPSAWSNLKIVFFYGSDYDRNSNRTIWSSLLASSIWIYLSLTLLIALLFFIRRIQNLRQNGIISCSIDIIAGILGSGNLHISHMYEKWFFGIVSIAGIFISAIGIYGILFPSFLIPDKEISTFEELNKINPPIYGVNIYRTREAHIREILRFNIQKIGF